jgi:addiction module HigA family antidote
MKKESALSPIKPAPHHLRVNRQAFNNQANIKSGISPEMAIRLEKMDWAKAGGWMRLKMNYDLAQAQQKADQRTVHPLSSNA